MKTAEPKFFAARWEPALGGTRARKILGEAVFIALLLIFSFWLMFHTFGYNPKTNSILIGSRLWSDFGANLPMIRSFSMGTNLDRMIHVEATDYPLYAGEPIRKHFLFYALVGFLERIGLRIDWALNLPSALGFFALLLGIYLLAQKLFRSTAISFLSVLFFLFNGSLSFIKYFSEHSVRELSTIVEFPSFAPWGPGDITAFWNLNIYTNQRHLAAGFAIGVWFLIWVLKSNKAVVGAVLWGLVIGILPYFHQPMLLIMAILLGSCFLFFPSERRFILITGSIAFLFVVPQVMLMPKGESLGWFPGYLIHDDLTVPRFLWYWFQNLGLHAIFIPLGFFFIPRTPKKMLAPLFFIFLVANLFRFSVEVAASHKFFNFALILGNMISAYVVVWISRRMWPIAMPLVGILVLSGAIDFMVVKNDVSGSIADVTADPRASWIATNTPRDAVFLDSSYLYHPASMAGRSIFLGWPYFPWSEGYKGDRMNTMKTMYESRDPGIFCPILRENNISYVTVEDTHGNPNLPQIDEAYFRGTFRALFQTDDYAIFGVADMCNGISFMSSRGS